MGTTIEFYSADPQDFVTLFSSPIDEQDREAFFRKLKTYPVADFSFHVLIPDDLDRLCQIIRTQGLSVFPVFTDNLVKVVWDDGESESITLVSDSFVSAIAKVDDEMLEKIASEWAKPFHYKQHIHTTPAYRGLLQLRDVCRDVIRKKTSLLLRLLY
jgi:hypothetical protein